MLLIQSNQACLECIREKFAQECKKRAVEAEYYTSKAVDRHEFSKLLDH